MKVYERSRLIGQDVGKDFKSTVLTPELSEEFDQSEVHYERSNPRLSYSALQVLKTFNKMKPDDTEFKGVTKDRLRQPLIAELHNLNDDFGEVLPSRQAVETFYARFSDDNQTVFSNWGDGQSFNDDFSMFPIDAPSMPRIDAKALLTQYLEPALRAL